MIQIASRRIARARAAWAAALLVFAGLCAAAPPGPVLRDGVLELAATETGRSHELRGAWGFTWQRFEDPQVPSTAAAQAAVPGAWNGVLHAGRPVGADGFATYALEVACPAGERLALSVPAQRSALRLYVNGQPAARQGTPGASASQAQPAIGGRAVLTESFACPLRITAHVSNFSHRTGGMVRAPTAGPWTLLAAQRKQQVVMDTLLLGAYLVLGALPVFFFLARRRDPSPLLFGLFCLTQALYLDMTGERLTLQLFAAQTSWEVYLKIEYGAWFATMALFLLLIHKLFEREMQQGVVRLLLAGLCLPLAVVVLTPARLNSHLVAYGQALAVLSGAYITFCIARAARHGRDDAGVILAGMGFLLAITVLDVLQYNAGIVSRSITPFGLLGFALSPAIVLARRLARALNVEELRSVEQRGRADLLVRVTQAGILDWDDTRNLTTYSPRLKELLGYPADADTTGWPAFFERIHPYERAAVEELFERQLKDRAVRSGEVRHEPRDYRLLRRDGSHVWVHAEAISLRSSDGRMLRYICSFLDITDQRALAEGLRRQNAALAENARLRDDVERMSRHDLKTPLNSIIGVTRLLRDDARLSAEQHDLLGITERAGYRLLEMVNLSLDLSRMELGSYDFRPQAVNLADVVARVMLDLQGLAEDHLVQLRMERAFSSPVYARAEELLCYSILANLLRNAVEATPRGGAVHVRLEPGEPVRLHVRNPGQVPPSIAHRFFDKYVTAGKSGGTGLGTYSARLMARVQEGELEMHSSESGGTTLTLTLRALGAEQLPPPPLRALRESGRKPPAPADAADFAPRRVLLADDDEYNRLLLRRFLPTPPFTVEAVANGRGAIEAVAREWPDIVLIDMEMPVMNGVEAVAWIRARERQEARAPCVIVMLSSNDDALSIRKGLQAGSDRFLTKPVTREALLAVMHELDEAAHSGPSPLPPAQVPDSGPPVPFDAAVRVEAALASEFEAFLASRRALVDQMLAALAQDDLEQVRALAHRAGGGLALFGFRWAAWQSRRIEMRAGDPAKALPADLRREIESLREHLAQVQVL